jgi:hypothetical protein
LWARQALASKSRGQNSHGGVAPLIGCAFRDRRTGHTLGANRFLEGPGRLQEGGQGNGDRETLSFDGDGGGDAAAHSPLRSLVAGTLQTWGQHSMVMVISPSHQTRRLLSSQHSQRSGTAKRLRSRRRAHAGPGKRPRCHTDRRASQAWLACLHHSRLSRPVLDVIAISSTGPPSDARLSVCCSVACISTEIASQTPLSCPSRQI